MKIHKYSLQPIVHLELVTSERRKLRENLDFTSILLDIYKCRFPNATCIHNMKMITTHTDQNLEFSPILVVKLSKNTDEYGIRNFFT